jgi:hypothetical protein
VWATLCAQALDFQEDIEADQGLLAKARRLRKGDQMSRDEYNAVQRKVRKFS